MDFFFFQSFFDDLSEKIIPPLLSNLTYFTLKDFTGTLPLLEDDLSINYSLKGLKVVGASIDPTPPLIKINNGEFTVAVSNLNFNLTTDYQFISDPPILADIGEANFAFANTTMSTDVSTYLHAGDIEDGEK